MQVIGICRFSYPGEGGFQVEHDSLEERKAHLYAPARLEERFATFETMMLPPLKAQTDPDFTLLVVIGDSLPNVYRDRLQAAIADMPQAILVARPPGPHRKVMQKVINEVRQPSGAPCLQFRMDDDDAVAVDFVARLRETAHDLGAFALKERHIAIDFNQGYFARPTAKGLFVAPTQSPYFTAALALMIRHDLDLSVMNFSHIKLAQKMPTVTLTGEDMLIRGVNDHNDSRMHRAGNGPRLAPLDDKMRTHFKRRFDIDASAVADAFSALPG